MTERDSRAPQRGGPPLPAASPPASRGERGSDMFRAFLVGGSSGRFSAVGVGFCVPAWVDRLDSCLRRNDEGGRNDGAEPACAERSWRVGRVGGSAPSGLVAACGLGWIGWIPAFAGMTEGGGNDGAGRELGGGASGLRNGVAPLCHFVTSPPALRGESYSTERSPKSTTATRDGRAVWLAISWAGQPLRAARAGCGRCNYHRAGRWICALR